MPAPASPPAAPAQGGDIAAIRQAEQLFETAQTTGDGATLDRLLVPDFLFVRASGRVGNKHDFVDGFTRETLRLQPIVVSDPLLVRPTADTAIVGGESWLRGTDAGRPVAEHFRFATTWVRRNGRWLVAFSQITGLPRD